MNLSKKDLEIFSIVLRKPGMFLINRVEDYYMFFQGYTFNNKQELHIFINEKFSLFVGEKVKIDGHQNNWHRTIRYSSSTDSHSLELFSKRSEERRVGKECR